MSAKRASLRLLSGIRRLSPVHPVTRDPCASIESLHTRYMIFSAVSLPSRMYSSCSPSFAAVPQPDREALHQIVLDQLGSFASNIAMCATSASTTGRCFPPYITVRAPIRERKNQREATSCRLTLQFDVRPARRPRGRRAPRAQCRHPTARALPRCCVLSSCPTPRHRTPASGCPPSRS